jgi:uncharacterized protein YegL
MGMTNTNLTLITVVLDRSGSMGKLSTETITGFNKFLADQKKLEGKANLTLATFASDYTLIHDFCPLESVADLSPTNYITGGYTSLYDAVCRTIDTVGTKLAAMNETDRPGKIITVIITDGQENASREFKHSDVMHKINHQTEKYNWNFVFLGNTIGQVETATSFGVRSRNALKYDATRVGIGASYSTISSNMTAYRNNNDQRVDNFFDLDKATDTPNVADTNSKDSS